MWDPLYELSTTGGAPPLLPNIHNVCLQKHLAPFPQMVLQMVPHQFETIWQMKDVGIIVVAVKVKKGDPSIGLMTKTCLPLSSTSPGPSFLPSNA